MRLCGGQTGRGAPGSRKTWPLSVASAPGFTQSPPARGWPVSLAGATRQAPHLVRSSPHPLPQSGARPPPSALQQGCGRGRCESRGPPKRFGAGGRSSRVPHWPSAGQFLAAGFLSNPRPGAVGAGAAAATSSGLCLVGPGTGKWIGYRRIGVQVCFWGPSERAPPDGSPVYMSAQAGFPSSWYFCCRFSALGAAGSRLTGRPPCFLRRDRTSLTSLGPRCGRSLALAHRATAGACSVERLPGSSQRGSRALPSRFSYGGRPNPAPNHYPRPTPHTWV